MNSNETIAAVSTPAGQGGIGIVRMSGSDSLCVLGRIFEAAKKTANSEYTSHTVHYGNIIDPTSKVLIDEVLVTVMKAPKTYTKEDIVEINCHGGESPLRNVLKMCLDNGARIADPGEFTKRAFLSGRLDLSQAEAVLDIITSSSDAACKIAVGHLKGDFSQAVKKIKESLLDVIAEIELGIDFSQEDVAFSEVKSVMGQIKSISVSLEELLETSDKGLILRNGASVVICGRPNVGKSSLMNALLRDDRVIVTPIAGTTRDIVEESISLGGVRVKLSDTAGIIETKDRVELEGIKRSKEKLRNADVVIFVLDASRELSDKDKEIFDVIGDRAVVIVANKTDLKNKLSQKETTKIFKDKMIKVSVLKKLGLEKIEEAVKNKLFKGDPVLPEGPIVDNLRHKSLLENALTSLRRTEQLTGEAFNGELVASDINEAIHHLGSIIGESVEADILDRIFSQFCIGK